MKNSEKHSAEWNSIETTGITQKQRKNRRGTNPRSLANLEKHKFVSGRSGNPGGVPKGTPRLSTAYQKLLGAESLRKAKALVDNLADEIAIGVLEKAVAGDVRAAGEIADRTEGKVPNKIEGGDQPLEIRVNWIDKGIGGEDE